MTYTSINLTLESGRRQLLRKYLPKSVECIRSRGRFPWVNTSYPDVIHNLMTYDGALWQWHPDTTQLSWQLKLYQLTKRICEVLGYKVDFSEWSASPFRSLIVCNTLPAAWNIPQYARALPTWTVAEYFEKLELFLSCEFDFDHRAKTVKFSFSKTVIDNLPEIEIKRWLTHTMSKSPRTMMPLATILVFAL